MTSATNVEITQQMFAAFGAANIPAILELVDDDIVIAFYGPPEIPYAGTSVERGRSFQGR